MKNGKDFIYEYSDLNVFNTRVKVLKGKYKGLVAEFGGSCLLQSNKIKDNRFVFDYILYVVPEPFNCAELRSTAEFNEFMGLLLIDIIKARRLDKDDKNKLDETLLGDSTYKCSIPVDQKFYDRKRAENLVQRA